MNETFPHILVLILHAHMQRLYKLTNYTNLLQLHTGGLFFLEKKSEIKTEWILLMKTECKKVDRSSSLSLYFGPF